jgi:hypothetical protein
MSANFEGDWACRCCVGSQSCGDRSGRGDSRVFRRLAASPGRRNGDKPQCCVTANVQWRTAGHDIISSARQTVEHIVEGSMKRLLRALVLVALVTTPALAGGPKIRAGYVPRLSYHSDWMGSVANSTRSAVQRADRSNIFESDSLAHQSCINPDRQFPSLMIGKSYGAC